MAEFSPETELLAAVFDRLGELIKVQVAASGSKKKPKIKPWTRPETAADILKARKIRDNYRHLESVLNFVPTGDTPPPEKPSTVTASITRVRR